MFTAIRLFISGLDVPRWLICALLVTAVLGFTGWQGYRLGAAKLDRYIADQAVEAVRINTARAKVTADVEVRYIKTAGETQFVTRWVEKEVDNYADHNTGLCLDADWRRLHDGAAHNTIPDPSGGPHAALRASGAAAEGRSPTDRR